MTEQSGRLDPELICGINPVKEALRSGRVKELYISETRKKGLEEVLSLSRKADVPVKWVDSSFFDSRFPKGHQSIAALVKKRRLLQTDDLLKKIGSRESSLIIILDEIEDPRNLGAILRVAEAGGADGVVIQRHRQTGISPEVIKSSAGAYEYVDIAVENNIKYAINTLKKEGFTIIGSDSRAEKSLWDVSLRGRIGLVMGSEGKGIRQSVLRLCDEIVCIPMLGKVNSLNVSVATGIMVFEAMRQRRYLIS